MAKFTYDNGGGFKVEVNGTIDQVLEVQELLLSNSKDKKKADIMFDTLLSSRKFKVGDKVKVRSKSTGRMYVSTLVDRFYRENGYLIIKSMISGGRIVAGDGDTGDFFLESDLEHYKGE